eukprot:9450931-Pyramimonas_sp.AAC.1
MPTMRSGIPTLRKARSMASRLIPSNAFAQSKRIATRQGDFEAWAAANISPAPCLSLWSEAKLRLSQSALCAASLEPSL